MKLFRRLKKGISMVEVSIAIAIIAIVSVASISVLTYSIKSQQKSARDLDVAIMAENVIDCFRFSGDLSFVEEIYGENFDGSTITKDSFTMQIIVSGNTLSLIALDLEGNIIYSTNYEKTN